MGEEQARLDILDILYSKRNGGQYLSYRELKDRLCHVTDPQMLSELISMKHLNLIHIQNGLTRFLEGPDFLGRISITAEGETYFKDSLKKKKLLLLANAV